MENLFLSGIEPNVFCVLLLNSKNERIDKEQDT